MKKLSILLSLVLIAITGLSVQAYDIFYTIEDNFYLDSFSQSDPFNVGSDSFKAIIKFTLNTNQNPFSKQSNDFFSLANYYPIDTKITIKGTNSDGTYSYDYPTVTIINGTGTIPDRPDWGKVSDQYIFDGYFNINKATYNINCNLVMSPEFYKNNEKIVPKTINQRDLVGPSTYTPHYIRSTNGILDIYKSTDVKISSKKEQSKLYGLFEGVKTPVIIFNPIKGDEYAKQVRARFIPIPLPNNLEEDLKWLHGDLSTGGVKKSDIQSYFTGLRDSNKLNAGDNLIAYFGPTHGGLSTISSSYYIVIGPKDHDGTLPLTSALTDHELFQALQGMDSVNKWVFIDACLSGGFWNELSNLNNIALFAAADKDDSTITVNILGISYSPFSSALVMAFNKNNDGKFIADIDGKDGVSFDELDDFLTKKYPQTTEFKNFLGMEGIEMDTGDSIIFTADMWNPVAYKTSDFEGAITTAPIPGSMLLFSAGIAGLVCFGYLKRQVL